VKFDANGAMMNANGNANTWPRSKIGNLGRVIRGSSPRPAGDIRYFDGDFMPWLTVGAITNATDYTTTICQTETMLTTLGASRSTWIKAGAVILANSGFSLGVAKVLGMDCCANDGVAAIIGLKSVDPIFLTYAINAQTENLRKVVSRGNDQPNLNTDLIRTIEVPSPPLPEQRAIAAALSDTDALIASMDALIAKKRDLKQAAMQQLLTGKTRLPGFTGAWEVKRLGEVTAIRNHKINTFDADAAAFCVELEQVCQNSGQIEGHSDARTRRSVKYLFQKGDVLFGRLRPYLRKFWWATREGVCSTEIWPLIPIGNRLVSGFLFQTVQTDAFIDAANSSYGTHMPRSDWNALAKFDFHLPVDPAEQAAIAEVLSDMDADLAALETQRDKARALKQGMMQELLTGRIRLV
jgi:type I restriction enzyme S subunit